MSQTARPAQQQGRKSPLFTFLSISGIILLPFAVGLGYLNLFPALFPKSIRAFTSLLAGSAAPSSLATPLISPDGKTGRLPALGWSSWNEYEDRINETVFVRVAELLNELGLKDLGYEYVNIDDAWSDKAYGRDRETKELRPDYVKFPNGIAGIAEKVHEYGLKLGIYSDAGTLTCAGYEGSLGYEEIDAATFAKWGVDYLKYDNCNVPKEWNDEWRWWPELWYGGPPDENQSEGDPGYTSGLPAPDGYDWSTSNISIRYERMRDALLRQNGSIQYSLCAWGHGHVDQWGPECGHSWRMWGDIYPVWQGKDAYSWGIMPIVNHASFFTHRGDFWGHNDYDMLEVGNGNLTLEENRSHFALWAALKSPLIIGTPLDPIPPAILSILSNPDLISFNQDPNWGHSAIPYKWGLNPDFTWNQTHPAEYYVGPSSKGLHIFVLNSLDTEVEKEVVFAEVPGLEGGKGKGYRYRVYDMWSGEEMGVFEGGVRVRLGAHDTAALRVNGVDGSHPAPNFKPPRNWGEKPEPSVPKAGEKPEWW